MIKIITIHKNNTSKKTFTAGVHGSHKIYAYGNTEIKALEKLLIKLKKNSDKWVLSNNK